MCVACSSLVTSYACKVRKVGQGNNQKGKLELFYTWALLKRHLHQAEKEHQETDGCQ